MDEKSKINPLILDCFLNPENKKSTSSPPNFQSIKVTDDEFKLAYRNWFIDIIKEEMYAFIKARINKLYIDIGEKGKKKEENSIRLDGYKYKTNETILLCIKNDELSIEHHKKTFPDKISHSRHVAHPNKDLIDSFFERKTTNKFQHTYVIDDVTSYIKRFTSALNAIETFSHEHSNLLYFLYTMKHLPRDEDIETEHNSIPYQTLNDTQKDIVDEIEKEKITFIQGPPGTGKSQTILAIATEYATIENKLLITAVSNKAVDSVIEKFHKYNMTANPKLIFMTYGEGLDEKFKDYNYKSIAFEVMKKNYFDNTDNYSCELFLLGSYKEYNFFDRLSKILDEDVDDYYSRNKELLDDISYFVLFRKQGSDPKQLKEYVSGDNLTLKQYADIMFSQDDQFKLFTRKPRSSYGGAFDSDNEEMIGGADSQGKVTGKKNFYQRMEFYIGKILNDTLNTVVMMGTIHSYSNFMNNVFKSTKTYLPISQIVVDEAGLLTEPDMLLLFEEFQGKGKTGEIVSLPINKIIFVGDPYQLPPFTYKQNVFEKDENIILPGVFNRAEEASKHKDINIYRMHTQYRMHPDICRIVSHISYNKKLTTDIDVKRDRIINGKGLEWIDVEAESDELCETDENVDGNIKYNIHECIAVIKLIKEIQRIKKEEFDPKKILIISPYNGQVEKLKEFLKDEQMENINVVTVDKSQGSEEDTVIISAVRCDVSSIGFLKLKNRVMVAISRAKYNLYIVGNAKTLCKVDIWRDLYIACYYSKIINSNVGEENDDKFERIENKKDVPRSINFEIFRSMKLKKKAISNEINEIEEKTRLFKEMTNKEIAEIERFSREINLRYQSEINAETDPIARKELTERHLIDKKIIENRDKDKIAEIERIYKEKSEKAEKEIVPREKYEKRPELVKRTKVDRGERAEVAKVAKVAERPEVDERAERAQQAEVAQRAEIEKAEKFQRESAIQREIKRLIQSGMTPKDAEYNARERDFEKNEEKERIALYNSGMNHHEAESIVHGRIQRYKDYRIDMARSDRMPRDSNGES